MLRLDPGEERISTTVIFAYGWRRVQRRTAALDRWEYGVSDWI